MTEKLQIEVNLDNARIGDLRLFEALRAGDFRADDLIEFFDRIVSNEVDVASLPLTAMREIIDAVEASLTMLGAEKN